jgi:hypothetical protein
MTSTATAQLRNKLCTNVKYCLCSYSSGWQWRRNPGAAPALMRGTKIYKKKFHAVLYTVVKLFLASEVCVSINP